jgi:tRNA A22 N-methylase
MDKVKPLHHIRYGTVEASIWENLTQGEAAFYNVTFAKHYKDGDEWKTSQSFGMGDLLELSKVADHAHTWIARLQEKARENTRAEQMHDRRSTARQGQQSYSDRVGMQEQRRGQG